MIMDVFEKNGYKRKLCVSCLAIYILIVSFSWAQSENAPNFVFILGDDQGWNALSTQMDPNEPIQRRWH
jgi:hypothetical protein